MKIKTNVLAGKSLITNCHGLNPPPGPPGPPPAPPRGGGGRGPRAGDPPRTAPERSGAVRL